MTPQPSRDKTQNPIPHGGIHEKCAVVLVARSDKKPIDDKVLYPYPNPKILGLILDPKETAKVEHVTSGSAAERDGFLAGDEIVTLAGQPILSIADVQWVLHHAGDVAKLSVDVSRDGKTKTMTLTLAKGWRQRGDISWRASSWDLRRMTLGGMRLETLPEDQRRELKLPANELALRAKWVGQYNDHAVAKRAGFLKDDIILAIDGDRTPITESELMARFLQSKLPGDKITMSVLRGQQKLELTFDQQ